MEESIYALIRKADIVVLASPVFFYNVSAQAKTLIDRCQMFWGRKYKLKLLDPHSYTRQGFLLSVAASKGKKLFDGVHLTAKYFFDAISANYYGALTYKGVEGPRQITSEPNVQEDLKKAAKDLCSPFLEKKSLLFLSKHDACRGQIAGAFARIHAKGKLTVRTAGYDARDQILPELVPVMVRKNLDLMYQTPRHLGDINPVRMPDMVISLDCEKEGKKIPARDYQNWNIPMPDDTSPESLKSLVDELEPRIENLINSVNGC